MNKTKLLLAMLALLLCVGVQAADVTETLNAVNSTTEPSLKNGGTYVSGATLSDKNAGFSSNTIKISSNKTATFTFSVQDAYKSKYYIKAIDITYKNNNQATSIKINNIAASSSTSWSAGTTQPTIASFTVTTGSSQININAIKFTLAEFTGGDTPTPTPSKTDVTLSFPAKEYTATVGDAFEAPTLTVNPKDAASAVKYTSSKASVATVDATTGAVTLKAAGSTTITAAISGSDTYNDASASYTLTVSEKSVEPVDPDEPDEPTEPGQLSKWDENRPVGWGANTTGSGYKGYGDGTPVNPVLVTTAKALTAALQGTEPRTIYVKGTLIYDGADTIRASENKTIIGLPGAVLKSKLADGMDAATVKANINLSGILCFAKCNNIIIRNLTFQGPGSYDVSGKDNLTFHGSTNMWVDHCTFLDGIDGNFDIIHGSDNVSVTWCKFDYSKSGSHNFSDLIGHDDWNYAEDEGHLNVTLGNNWWGSGVKDRCPRMRYGKLHEYNCYFTTTATAIKIGYMAQIYADYNDFNKVSGNFSVVSKGTRKTYNSGDDGSAQYYYKGENNGPVTTKTSKGKTTTTAKWNTTGKAGNKVVEFKPTYSYKHFDSYTQAKDVITNTENGAGPTLDITLPSNYETYIQPKAAIASGRQFATFASGWNTDWSGVNGAKAYIITSYKDAGKDNIQNLMLKQVDVVPAGTGVVLYGVPGSYEPNVTDEAVDANTVDGNMLVGTVCPEWIGATGDILSLDKDVTGVDNPNKYKDDDEDPSNGIQRADGNIKDDDYYDYILKAGKFVFSAPGQIAAFKAYLHLPKSLRDGNTSSEAKGWTMVFENTDGIDTLQDGVMSHEEKFDNAWYTISGVRLSAEPTQRGVYIHNGKKVVVK